MPAGEVMKRISACTITPNDEYSDRVKSYKGYVYEHNFVITRIINYRNSFLPEIRGKVYEENGQTYILINMQLIGLVKAFIILWLAGTGTACVGVIAETVKDLKSVISWYAITIIPFGMLASGCILAVIPFKVESGRSKKFIQQLFEAYEV